MTEIRALDSVVLLKSIASRHLPAGAVGTVVELLDDSHFEVEFADLEGNTYAFAAIPREALLKLIYRPADELSA